MKHWIKNIALVAVIFAIGYVAGGLCIGRKAATKATQGTILANLQYLNRLQENIRGGKIDLAKTAIDEAVNHDIWILRNFEETSSPSLLNDLFSQPDNFNQESRLILQSTSDNFVNKSNVLSADNSIYLSDLIAHIH